MTVILVDGLPLSTPSAVRGIGTYLRSVLERVATRPDLHVRALVTDGARLPAGVTPVPIHRWARDRKSFYEQLVRLPRDIVRGDADVFHSPGVDPPRRSAVPWVQTLHDLIPLAYPGSGYRAERVRWRLRGRLIQRAAAVIADSRHTADDAVRVLGLDRAKIHVVYLGADPAFRPRTSRGSAAPPFLLYVGATGPTRATPRRLPSPLGWRGAGSRTASRSSAPSPAGSSRSSRSS